MKDIAKEVGVSTALVSYVLNNLKEGRIRKEVAQRIRDAATRLNYRPNQIARSLKTRKTFTLGLIVADISNPFSSTLARIVEDEANKLNYTVIFGSSDENAAKFERVLDTLLYRQVDGLIISPPAGSEKQITDLLAQDVPFVLLDRYFPGIKTNYVILDNLVAAREATMHLLDNACTRPAMISYATDLVHLKDREEGFNRALQERGIKTPRSHMKRVDITNDPKEIEKTLLELLHLPEPPDGLLLASNIIAANCLKIINGTTLKVPDDLAIVCFDESESLDLFYAPLTFVRQPLQKMGETATKILVEQIARKSGVTQVQLGAELVIRKSSIRK